jgi:hypothetical protein
MAQLTFLVNNENTNFFAFALYIIDQVARSEALGLTALARHDLQRHLRKANPLIQETIIAEIPSRGYKTWKGGWCVGQSFDAGQVAQGVL